MGTGLEITIHPIRWVGSRQILHLVKSRNKSFDHNFFKAVMLGISEPAHTKTMWDRIIISSKVENCMEN